MKLKMRRRVRQVDGWMGLVLLAVALPCLLGAGRMAWRSLELMMNAEHVAGEVVEVSGDVPRLTVAYTAPGGERRQLRSEGSDLYQGIAVGDTVMVLHDPADPDASRLNLFVEMWLLPLLLGVFGGFFALFVPLVGLPRLFRRDLARHGQLVDAEYLGFDLALDMSLRRKRPDGTISLTSLDGHHRLTHNGRVRDPLDPAVQRELGIGYVILARWQDPARSEPLYFESGLLADNPERALRTRRVRVRFDPRDPGHHVFEPPFGPGIGPARVPAVQ